MEVGATSIGALLVAGVLGGGVAVGIDKAVGDEDATTVIREVTAGTAESTAFRNPSGKTISDIYGSAKRGVIQVLATSVVSDNPFFGSRPSRALGSGFVIDKAGHVVTNYHVIEGASKVEVSFSGNDEMPATVIGRDPSTDIAVLRIKRAQGRALTPLELGNSDAVRVGDAVVAIGNPFGLERTVTAGIVSALQREITAPNGFAIDRVIQTDAAINHGNSGGPLIDDEGRVIGVNAQIESESGGNDGVGFAIPSNTVKSIVSELISTGKAEHAYLGVSVETVNASVRITEVRAGTPAADAGLKSGDRIVSVDGKRIVSGDGLTSAISAKKPGDTVSVTYNRGGQSHTVKIELASRPT